MAQKILVAGGLTCTVVGLGVLSRDLVNAYSPEDPSPKYPKSLDGKVYLVTGANSGQLGGSSFLGWDVET